MRSCPGPLRNALLRNEGADQDLFLLSRGELPAGRRVAVRMHLLTCSACRARVAEFRQVSGLLAASLGGGGRPTSSLTRMPLGPVGLFVLVATIFTTAAFVWRSQAEPPALAPAVNGAVNGQGGAACEMPAVMAKRKATQMAIVNSPAKCKLPAEPFTLFVTATQVPKKPQASRR
jgi:anti-sigma factor RsiW